MWNVRRKHLNELTNRQVLRGFKGPSHRGLRTARDYLEYFFENETAFLVVIRARPRAPPDQDSWRGGGGSEARVGYGPRTGPATGEALLTVVEIEHGEPIEPLYTCGRSLNFPNE